MTVPVKRGPPPATTRVHVNNLPWQLDPTVVKQELQLVCAKYGVVEDVYIAPYVEGPRESKVRNALKVHAGWARVTFATLEDSGRAVLSLPGSDLLGSRIRAHYAKPEPVAEAPPDPAAVAARLELIAARKSQYQRRRARQFEKLQAILQRLPAPGGLDAMEHLPSLAALLPPIGQPIVDWNVMPAACDPCRGGSLGAADSTLIDPCDDAEGDDIVGVDGGGGDACGVEDCSGAGAGTAAASELDPDRHLPLRGRKKRWQVESFVLVLRAMLTEQKPYRLVDFGSGTGNLLLPLAALFPWCSFHAVEMKPNAVSLLLSRAAAAGLTNVTAEVGMIEHSSCAFDVALALHACGNATDYAMALALTQRAAYVAIPCCIGKLKFSVDHGGSSFHRVHKRWTPRFVEDPAYERALQQLAPDAGSTSAPALVAALKPLRMSDEDRAALGGSRGAVTENDTRLGGCSTAGEGDDARAGIPLLTHPRSDWLRSNLADPVEDFKAIARVGDISHGASQDGGQGITHVHAPLARLCKLHIELDRNEAAHEEGYEVALFEGLNSMHSSKTQLLLGVPPDSPEWSTMLRKLL